jgi:hypothetical protein
MSAFIRLVGASLTAMWEAEEFEGWIPSNHNQISLSILDGSTSGFHKVIL